MLSKHLDEYIKKAHEAGVKNITVPGTDIETSQTAITIAQNHEGIYAAVGIHPHHVFKLRTSYEPVLNAKLMKAVARTEVEKVRNLISSEKVVAIGEIGLDKHTYTKTKYETYVIDDVFMAWQRELFIGQLKLAIEYKKSIIFHNREAKKEMLRVLNEIWDTSMEYHTTFHCCEPDKALLEFAKQKHIFIGVDGDLTFRKDKQEFITSVPLQMLVLETDAPFLLPEPYRSRKEYPNMPAYVVEVAKKVAEIQRKTIEEIEKQTSENAQRLFQIK